MEESSAWVHCSLCPKRQSACGARNPDGTECHTSFEAAARSLIGLHIQDCLHFELQNQWKASGSVHATLLDPSVMAGVRVSKFVLARRRCPLVPLHHQPHPHPGTRLARHHARDLHQSSVRIAFQHSPPSSPGQPRPAHVVSLHKETQRHVNGGCRNDFRDSRAALLTATRPPIILNDSGRSNRRCCCI